MRVRVERVGRSLSDFGISSKLVGRYLLSQLDPVGNDVALLGLQEVIVGVLQRHSLPT